MVVKTNQTNKYLKQRMCTEDHRAYTVYHVAPYRSRFQALALDHPSLCNISVLPLSSRDPSPAQLRVPHRDDPCSTIFNTPYL